MIDTTDKSLLSLLQQNSKLTIKELARHLNLTQSPIFERIKRLEKEGYIKGYTAKIDRKKVGLKLLVFCNISLKEHDAKFIATFEKDIQGLDEVIACYHIGGLFDYLLKVVCTDMDAYQEFVAKKLASLGNIGRVQSSFVMTEVKEQTLLPIL